MTHNYKTRCILVLYSFLFIALSGSCIYYEKYTADNLSTVSVRYDKASISPKQADRIREYISNYPQIGLQDLTLWNLKKNEILKSCLTERAAFTNIIEISGDISHIFPITFLCGNKTTKNDYEGCVLDSETSYQLFGTTNAVDNTVLWKERKYIVRGVVKTKDKMMLIRPDDNNYLYTYIEADYPEKIHKRTADNEGNQLEQLLLDYDLPSAEVVLDGVLNLWLLHTIIRLPLLVAMLAAAFYLIKAAYRTRSSIILFLLYGTGALLAIFLMIRVSGISVHIPSQFIPTRWSDFHFYSNKFLEWREQSRKIRSCKLMLIDLLRNQILLKCFGYTLINILLLVLFWHRVPQKRRMQ